MSCPRAAWRARHPGPWKGARLPSGYLWAVGPDRGLHVVLTEDIDHLAADQGAKAEPSSYKKGLPSKEKLGKI